MKFGIVVPIWIHNKTRLGYAQKSFTSLGKTVVEGLDGPIPLLFVTRDSLPICSVEAFIHQFAFPQFDVQIISQWEGNIACDGAVIYGYDYLVREYPDVTHLIFLTDDWLYNSRWLLAMRDLILRRPQAKAWWVYRSSFEYYHKTLRIDQPDVLVRSTCPQGCMTREEYIGMHLNYRDWTKDLPRACDMHFDVDSGTMTVDYQDGHKQVLPQGTTGEEAIYPVHKGLSLDLYDPWLRPGERWVTARSYILNIGLEGINQTPDIPEWSVDFVGE